MTEIQRRTIPVLLSGKDALVRSQTGSGKTLAYSVPILQALQEVRPKIERSAGILALIIVPTRELALQTYEWLLKLCRVSIFFFIICLGIVLVKRPLIQLFQGHKSFCFDRLINIVLYVINLQS
jgi:ATP-dependent RNA helicase DDX31/DBP7